MKKFCSIILVVILVLSSVVSVFATNFDYKNYKPNGHYFYYQKQKHYQKYVDKSIEVPWGNTSSLCYVTSIAMVLSNMGCSNADIYAIYKANGSKAYISSWPNLLEKYGATQRKTSLAGLSDASKKEQIITALNANPAGILVQLPTHMVVARKVVNGEVYFDDPAVGCCVTMNKVWAGGWDSVNAFRVIRLSNTGTTAKEDDSTKNDNIVKTTPTPAQCTHSSYNNYGKCKNCGEEYPMSVSPMSATTYQAVKDDVPVRNRPYSPESIIKSLSKGTKVTVVASGKNSAGNLWYKLNDGTWVYSGNLEKVKEEKASSTLSINVTQYPTSITKGSSFGLRGDISSNYNISSIKGYVINSSGSTVMSTSDYPDKKSVNIRYINLNEDMYFGDLSSGKYTLQVVVKDDSGKKITWERSFEVKSETKQETSCSHSSYDSYGKCKNCGKEYPMNVSSMSATTYQAVKNDVPVRNRPYSPENIIKYLSKGAKVTVVASAKNSVGNLWYKLSDGTWIYSGNLEKASTAPAQAQINTSSTSLRFELESVPKGNLQYGKSFPLKGWFRSDSAIVEARAYMLDSNKNIIMEEKASSTTNNYKIQGYKLDKAMKFSKLSPGAYFLKFYVKDANGDTATWISEKFYIVK